MANGSIVRLHASVTIPNEDWEVFKQLVADVKAIVRSEGIENVLTHETYYEPGSFNCLIVEAYASEQAFLNHLVSIQPVSEKYAVDWTINRLELSGACSEETVRLIKEGAKGGVFHFYGGRLGA